MQSKLIVITGYLASGKSTFASTLSERLRVPCFIKDRMKIALCESLGPISKAESSRFSAVTFDGMLYAAGQLLAVGQPAIPPPALAVLSLIQTLVRLSWPLA